MTGKETMADIAKSADSWLASGKKTVDRTWYGNAVNAARLYRDEGDAESATEATRIANDADSLRMIPSRASVIALARKASTLSGVTLTFDAMTIDKAVSKHWPLIGKAKRASSVALYRDENEDFALDVSSFSDDEVFAAIEKKRA
jgi:hypothetical protein